MLADDRMRKLYATLMRIAAEVITRQLTPLGITVTGPEVRDGQVFLLLQRGETTGGLSLDRIADETLYLRGGDPSGGFDPSLKTWEDVLQKLGGAVERRVQMAISMMNCSGSEQAEEAAAALSAELDAEVRIGSYEKGKFVPERMWQSGEEKVPAATETIH